MNRIIEEVFAISTSGMRGESDINNMTEKSDISKIENNKELLLKIE